MGGLGSGKGFRKGSRRGKRKKCAERTPSLSISEVMKLHKEHPSDSLVWSNMRLLPCDRGVYFETPADTSVATKLIEVSNIPCHYGGHRYLWHCPLCKGRIRKLYYSKVKSCLACLKCSDLTYSSQNATLKTRLWLKSMKALEKLNNNKWEKPKWMRQKTFIALKKECRDLEHMADFAEMFSVRNHFAAETLYEMYGDVAFVPMEVVLTHYGKNYNHEKDFDSGALWEKIESRSGGKMNRKNCL